MQHVAMLSFIPVFAGSVLERFFALLLHIICFLEEIGLPVAKLDTQFQIRLCVLADICGHLSKVDMLLQGRQKLLSYLYEVVEGITGKFSLFQNSCRCMWRRRGKHGRRQAGACRWVGESADSLQRRCCCFFTSVFTAQPDVYYKLSLTFGVDEVVLQEDCNHFKVAPHLKEVWRWKNDLVPVWRSRTSKISGSCQKVSGSWRRLARRYATSSSPERRFLYAHARRTGVTSGGRSTLTPCQNVETEFMTPAATVLRNKSFLRAAATTYFSTPYVAHSSAHVFLSFLCTTTTMPRRYVKLCKSWMHDSFPKNILLNHCRVVLGKTNYLDMVTSTFLPFVLILKHLNGIYVLQC